VLGANFVNQAVCGPVSYMPPTPWPRAHPNPPSIGSADVDAGLTCFTHRCVVSFHPLDRLPTRTARPSFMTGRRPDTLHTVTHVHPTYWRERAGPFWSLPQHFKEAGHHTSRYRWTPAPVDLPTTPEPHPACSEGVYTPPPPCHVCEYNVLPVAARVGPVAGRATLPPESSRSL